MINLYFNRLIAATEYQVKFIANKRLDFDLDETIIINEDLIEWQNSIFQLKKIWSKLAKNDVLTSILTDKSERQCPRWRNLSALSHDLTPIERFALTTARLLSIYRGRIAVHVRPFRGESVQ